MKFLLGFQTFYLLFTSGFTLFIVGPSCWPLLGPFNNLDQWPSEYPTAWVYILTGEQSQNLNVIKTEWPNNCTYLPVHSLFEVSESVVYHPRHQIVCILNTTQPLYSGELQIYISCKPDEKHAIEELVEYCGLSTVTSNSETAIHTTPMTVEKHTESSATSKNESSLSLDIGAITYLHSLDTFLNDSHRKLAERIEIGNGITNSTLNLENSSIKTLSTPLHPLYSPEVNQVYKENFSSSSTPNSTVHGFYLSTSKPTRTYSSQKLLEPTASNILNLTQNSSPIVYKASAPSNVNITNTTAFLYNGTVTRTSNSTLNLENSSMKTLSTPLHPLYSPEVNQVYKENFSSSSTPNSTVHGFYLSTSKPTHTYSSQKLLEPTASNILNLTQNSSPIVYKATAPSNVNIINTTTFLYNGTVTRTSIYSSDGFMLILNFVYYAAGALLTLCVLIVIMMLFLLIDQLMRKDRTPRIVYLESPLTLRNSLEMNKSIAGIRVSLSRTKSVVGTPKCLRAKNNETID